jgi:hypothetical protein
MGLGLLFSILFDSGLESAMPAEVIFVLRDGRTEAPDTRRKLLTEGGLYACLWEPGHA